MSVKTNLGRVGLVPRGEYDGAASYRRLDVVTFEGSTYVALCDVQGIAPEAVPNGSAASAAVATEDGGMASAPGAVVWQLLAQKGDTGDVGPTGPQGPQGEPGTVEDIPYSDSMPQAAGEASPGVSEEVSRADHVHPMPTAADVGARPSDWMPTAADVGARPSDWTPTAAQVGAIPANISKADLRTAAGLTFSLSGTSLTITVN